VNDKLRLFFRFSNNSSNISTLNALAVRTTSAYTLRTYTAGVSSVFSSRFSNELRLNYSSNLATSLNDIDSLGGNIPVDLLGLTGLRTDAVVGVFLVLNGQGLTLQQAGQSGAQRQWNLVDTTSLSMGRHQLKFGVDYRRLTPFAVPFNPQVTYLYFSESSVQQNNADLIAVEAEAPAYPLYTNFSAFAQDEWKVFPRLSLSLGLRWDVNPAPGVTQGLKPYTIQGSSSSTWALAPQGTPLWQTTWFNIAPRLGAAYILRNTPGQETVVRGGGGVFFDTGQQDGSKSFNGPGFTATNSGAGPFPCSPAPCSIATLVPTIVNPPVPPYGVVPLGFP
jgi:hypothetical protein